MTRLAKPGDNAITLAHPNTGKTCHVERQCSCYDDQWTVTASEPHLHQDLFKVILMGPYCAVGDELCYCKKDLIVLEDPDLLTPGPTEEDLKVNA